VGVLAAPVALPVVLPVDDDDDPPEPFNPASPFSALTHTNSTCTLSASVVVVPKTVLGARAITPTQMTSRNESGWDLDVTAVNQFLDWEPEGMILGVAEDVSVATLYTHHQCQHQHSDR
jgi:hypothetical protein